MRPDRGWSEEHEKLFGIMSSVAHFAMNKEHVDRRQLLERLVNAYLELEEALELLDRYEP